jgi:hypothetical protein
MDTTAAEGSDVRLDQTAALAASTTSTSATPSAGIHQARDRRDMQGGRRAGISLTRIARDGAVIAAPDLEGFRGRR